MAQKPRKNRKHFVLFNNGGVVSATTPKDWARAHRGEFPGYNFANADNTPTVEVIEEYLINDLGFAKLRNSQIVVTYRYIEL